MAKLSDWQNRKKMRSVLSSIIRIIFRIFECIVDGIFWLFNRKNQKTDLPPITNLLLLESASSLAIKIRTQKVSPFFELNSKNVHNPLCSSCIGNQ